MESAKRLYNYSFSLWETPVYILNLVVSFKLATNKKSEPTPQNEERTEKEKKKEEKENEGEKVTTEMCEWEEKDNNNEKNENPFKRKRLDYKTKVCHENADSLFSTSSGFNNYRGIVNLAMILLVLSCARVALENVIKYGILIDPISWVSVFIHDPYNWPSFSLVLGSSVFCLIAFYIETKLANGTMSENVGWFLQFFNLAVLITAPAIIVLIKHPNPVFSSITLLIYVALFLKLISYKHVNCWCRENRERKRTQRIGRNKSVSGDLANYGGLTMNGKSETLVQYPNNIHLHDMIYFLLAPTLCYELNFPRSGRIRIRFLIKRIAEMIFLSGLIIALIQQWILPIVNNARTPFKESNISKMVERILKLAVPNLIIWLLWFYWSFHSSLNVMAEVLRFGDRVFYKDWWNAESVQYFWQNWNIVVHKWALRHLYKPMLSKGYSKQQANVSVFVLSALFHEYFISVPLGMFRLWAFFGMIMQIPLAMFTAKYIKGGVWGNVIVWMSLIIGQPIAILMYYIDYYIMNIEE